jgi:aminoglycoside/choline kinase family phosphotransferase
MQQLNTINILKSLFKKYTGEDAVSVKLLPLSGSNRKYYRLKSDNNSIIGVFNNEVRENNAFLYLSQHFKKYNLPIPTVFDKDESGKYYIQEDLGDTTLFALIENQNNENRFNSDIIDLYKNVLKHLISFQTKSAIDLDFANCYPRQAFDKQSLLWDLNYFKYYFLKLSDIDFDEQLLEDDFQNFAYFLLQAENHFFMYRDFQSRNIMLVDNNPYFIDYQGGRKGALQYDVASLLYDAKADIPQQIRVELLNFYLDELEKTTANKRTDFLKYYNFFVAIRIMQALGTYGYRGLFQKKQHFIKSIPYAINNLKYLLNKNDWNKFPYLNQILIKLCDKWNSQSYKFNSQNNKLKISIHSFSFKQGIPEDYSGNGGGFVFDCRALPNPGRYNEYKEYTGLDDIIKEYLEKQPKVLDFIEKTNQIVMMSVENYLERGFNNLQVNFGCTGGRHRSVYMASQLAEYLKNISGVEVEISHDVLSTFN